MTIEYGLRANVFVLYDGTNSADVLASVASQWGSEAFIVSEEEGVLTVNCGSTIQDPAAIPTGYRFGVFDWMSVSPTDWASKYVKA